MPSVTSRPSGGTMSILQGTPAPSKSALRTSRGGSRSSSRGRWMIPPAARRTLRLRASRPGRPAWGATPSVRSLRS
ncbi:hypothetical protein VTN02DRAFT_4285 [Thermoascus thermophilus]